MKTVIDKIIRVCRCQFKYFLLCVSEISVNWHERVMFYYATGRRLNLNNPTYLNDKLFWLNRYWNHPIKTLCADKYRVREYLKEKGLQTLEVPLLGVYNDANEIKFDNLPNEFVLKCNHGCGYNIIVTDKTTINKTKIITQLKKWLGEDYGQLYNERHYSQIERCVIAEQYIDSSDNESLIDYKIQCINGSPYCILVCRERMAKTGVVLSSYSLNWARMDYLKKEDPVTIPKPKHLDEMIKYATIIAKDFPFVRVDFYDTPERIYLGEMTFTPEANLIDYYTDSFLLEAGRQLVLPENV